jgi:hypothetical protein
MAPKEENVTEDFLPIEYREAVNAYFKGVDIGYTGLKSYITVNVFFLTLMGLLIDPKIQMFVAAGPIVKFVPYFALGISAAFLAILPHYFKHLENCRSRCAQIEKLKHGKLFNRLGHISHGTLSKFITLVVLAVVVLSLIAVWLYFAISNFSAKSLV